MTPAKLGETILFRSFFPSPRLFFSSAVVWMLLAVIAWFALGDPMRGALSIDRFLVPPVCAVAPATAPGSPATGNSAPAATSSPAQSGGAGSTAATAAPAPVAAANCAAPDDMRFLSGEKVWLYEYVLLVTVLFCGFWYFFRRNEWYWWSVVGSAGILLV